MIFAAMNSDRTHSYVLQTENEFDPVPQFLKITIATVQESTFYFTLIVLLRLLR